MARSGTTWVGRMLCAGGSAGYLHEPFNLEAPAGAVRIPAEHWYEYVCEENEALFLAPLAKALQFRYPLGRELLRCRNRADLRNTARAWRSFVASRGRRALVKEPHAVFSAEWFAKRLESEVVITVRHPAAVVASLKRLEWSFRFTNLLAQPLLMRDHLYPYKAEMEAALPAETDMVHRAALLWRMIYSVVAAYRSRFPAFRIVRHEDLSRDPLGEYERLYNAVGLPFTDEAARAVAASSATANPKETTAVNPYETGLDSVANLDAWRSRLTRDEIRRIRNLTEQTARFYYADTAW
jgi:hypothetical protein